VEDACHAESVPALEFRRDVVRGSADGVRCTEPAGLDAHLFPGKEVRTPSRYDGQAKADRLVIESTFNISTPTGRQSPGCRPGGDDRGDAAPLGRQAEIDAGGAGGVTSESAPEIRGLKRKNTELERTIEILKVGGCRLRAVAVLMRDRVTPREVADLVGVFDLGEHRLGSCCSFL
jgi:transposase